MMLAGRDAETELTMAFYLDEEVLGVLSAEMLHVRGTASGCA
jgi:hypothetical protein